MSAAPRPSSPEEWQQTLSRLVHGDWPDIVEKLGSVAEVCLVTLRDADTTAEADRAVFDTALNQYVGSWRTDEAVERAVLHNMISLIAKFAPPAGFRKLIGQLNRVGTWWVYPNPASEEAVAAPEEERRTLLALESYFEGPEPDSGAPFFKAYIALLTGRLNSSLGPYCLRRLIELHVLEPGSDEFLELLTERRLETINELVSWIVDTNSDARSIVYAHLLIDAYRKKLLVEFDSIVLTLGCRRKAKDLFIYLETPFETIKINMEHDKNSELGILFADKGASENVQPDLRGLFS